MEGGQLSFFDERVVGGDDTVPGKYPWTVLLRSFNILIFAEQKKHEKYYIIIIIVRFQKSTVILLHIVSLSLSFKCRKVPKTL